MAQDVVLLMVEALAVYGLVLGAHALRSRFGLALFYALLGALTAVMSWLTDAGLAVEVGGISFLVGSTVFYTSLLLGVFVVYVFDGPGATRVAISTVVGVSILVPLVALVINLQFGSQVGASVPYVPMPSLRINGASVLTTLADLVFLAVAWELLGKPSIRMSLALRTFLTLLGVMCLDVILFNTGAFAGTPAYLSIMGGTFVNRLIVVLFAFPVLYVYLTWQTRKEGVEIQDRAVLSVVKEVVEVRQELSRAQEEIEERKRVEREKEELIGELRKALDEVTTLEGLLPICAHCLKIRNDDGLWERIESYIMERSEARFSHGFCPDCMEELYGDLEDESEPSA